MKYKFSGIRWRYCTTLWIPFVGILLIVIISLLIHFTKPNQLKTALKTAEENKPELIAVLSHYSKKDANEQKLKAAQFLISNCYIHSSTRTKVYDPNNNQIYFNPLIYPDNESAREAKDSLFKTSIIKRRISNDAKELSSSYLIKHIDFSFDVWKNSPWGECVNFDQFCRYILPYRVVDEPISDWTELLYSKYHHIIDTLSNKTILNACKAVNKVLAKDIQYENRWVTGGLGTMSIPEILKNKTGMCDDLVVFGSCVMRSLGIPVAVDFDIHGRFNYGHSWCVVFDEQGCPWSFGPGEEQPGEHIHTFEKYRWRKLAKVFRRNFQIAPEGINSQIKDLNSIPPFFKNGNITDVTDDYINTIDLELQISNKDIKEKIIYLCVYNNKTWLPLQFSEIKSGKVVFPKMGKEIMYCLGRYKNNRIYTISPPFILTKNGSKKIINGFGEQNNQKFFMNKISGYEYTKEGKNYNLYKWEDYKWKYIKDYKAAKDSLIQFQDLDKNTLYRFQETSRPFTVTDTLAIW